MLKKRTTLLCAAVFCTSFLCATGSFAEDGEEVKSAKDLILELAPSSPVEQFETLPEKPKRTTRGLVPKPSVPVAPPVQVSPSYRQNSAPPPPRFVPSQEYSNIPSGVPSQGYNRIPIPPVSAQVPQTQVPPPPSGSATLSAVQFVYNSDQLLPVAKRQLDQLVIALQDERLRHARIQLIGHTDAAGSREYNKSLSIRRARSAAEYLTQVHGIPPYRIIPIGMGEDQLLDPYNPLSSVNRRVEIIVVN